MPTARAEDLFLTLKYSDSRLPATREEAKRIARNFMRRLARAYRKTTGKKLKWWLVTASVSTKTGQPVRLHHHVVTDAMDWELIAQHWPPEEFSYRRLDATGDYTAVARYMIRNAGYGGARAWSPLSGYPAAPIFHAHPCGQSGHGAGAAGGPRG